jgi:hypothetical protein
MERKSRENTGKGNDTIHNLLIVRSFYPGNAKNGKTRHQNILMENESLYNFHDNWPFQLHYLLHEETKTSREKCESLSSSKKFP